MCARRSSRAYRFVKLVRAYNVSIFILKFKTDFWRTYGSAGDDERPEIPDPDSEYLELQLYLKSDDIMESNITETYDLDDDTYAEEEGKVYDVADDSEWKAVGEKIRINIR